MWKERVEHKNNLKSILTILLRNKKPYKWANWIQQKFLWKLKIQWSYIGNAKMKIYGKYAIYQ